MKSSKGKILIISSVIAIAIATGILGRDSSSLTEKIITENTHKGIPNTQQELEKFITEIVSIEQSFRQHHNTTKEHFGKALNILKAGKSLGAEVQVKAFQSIKQTQRDLEKFTQVASRFINSNHPKTQELAKECLIFIEYAQEVLNHYHSFISSSEEYISSEENIQQFTKHIALFNEQYDYLPNLIQEVKDSTVFADLQLVAFQGTKTETQSLTKWKDKTTDKLLTDAKDGDAAALYLVGQCYSRGAGGLPINIEAANRYFAASASLGFAPALEEIRLMYLEDNDTEKALFTQLIYLNLVSSFGHSELSPMYHATRKAITEKMGPEIMSEIERIARQKTIQIYETQNALEDSEDKATVVNTLLTTRGITAEDTSFEGDYWYNVSQKNKHEELT